MPERLLSTASTATSRPMHVRGCQQGDGPGFHYQPPGLMQRIVLRNLRRCGQADHWHATMRPHFTGASPAALASSPVRQRINYTIAMLVHRSLSGHVPNYLADDCRLVTDAGVRRLRSADTRTLVVGRTQSSFGDRTSAGPAPRLWNSLSSDIRQPDLPYGQFRRSLKTFRFGQ